MAEEEKITTLFDKTKEALVEMQSFDVETLPREKDLGQLNFHNAKEPAEKLISLYNQLSLSILEDLPDAHLQTIKTRADADLQLFQNILNFTLEQNNAHGEKNNIITSLKTRYQESFEPLYPLISYSTSKSADFKRLEKEARESVQNILGESNTLRENLESNKDEASQILTDIRKVAAEHGVPQQAIYYMEESEKYDELSDDWQSKTIKISIGLGLFAVLSLFLHKIPFMKPIDFYDTIQLAVSKILIFGVISYMLYLSARNFLSYRHNAIVNKHRHNALLTYKSLVDATDNREISDIVLTHASSCIYSPQPTGFSKDQSLNSPTAKSVVELLTKPMNAE